MITPLVRSTPSSSMSWQGATSRTPPGTRHRARPLGSGRRVATWDESSCVSRTKDPAWQTRTTLTPVRQVLPRGGPAEGPRHGMGMGLSVVRA